jgi:hypothetical protein
MMEMSLLSLADGLQQLVTVVGMDSEKRKWRERRRGSGGRRRRRRER